MKDPSVSVIIPVYNGARFIKKAVESVEKNTFKDFEIILVDDGSKDESKKTCFKIVKKYKNIRFFPFVKNKGLSHSLNFALTQAKGRYIARLNQDDTMTKDRLLNQVTFLEKNNEYVVVGGKVQLVDEKNRLIETISPPLTDEEIRKSWLILNPFYDPDVMYRKDAYLKTTGYDQIFYPADDYHMWYQMGKFGKLANLDKVVTKVLIHDKAATLRSLRLLIKKTWEVHLWAKNNVQKPSFLVYIYWLSQYWLGMILPIKLVFAVYLVIKKLVYWRSLSGRHSGKRTSEQTVSE